MQINLKFDKNSIQIKVVANNLCAIYTPAQFQNQVYKSSQEAIYVTPMATDFNADGNLMRFTICSQLETLFLVPVVKIATYVSWYQNVSSSC